MGQADEGQAAGGVLVWARAQWQRFGDWLGLDRTVEPDVLTTDPVRYFQEWDRHLPDRYWG